jgi:hypothetical protein
VGDGRSVRGGVLFELDAVAGTPQYDSQDIDDGGEDENGDEGDEFVHNSYLIYNRKS